MRALRTLVAVLALLAPAAAGAQMLSFDAGLKAPGVAAGATLTGITLNGTTTLGGTLNANGNLITNIGDAGTDFTAGGGLTLAGLLVANASAGFSGAVEITGDLSVIGAFDIVGPGAITIGDGVPGTTVDINTATWDLSYDGIATGFTSLTASGALSGGSLSISGTSALTGAVTFGATSRFGSDLRLDFGTAVNASTGSLEYDTGQTQAALMLRVPETSRTVHIGDQGDATYNYALGAQSNPTLAIHSANQSATQYNALSHSSTKATYTTGLGAHLFTAGSGNAIETASDQNILVGGAGFLYWRSTSTGIRESSGLEVQAGDSKGLWINTSRLQTEYATVASANDLTLTRANVFSITGTTTINAITTTNWDAGATVILTFEASVTVKHNTAGGASTAVMLLAGAADFSATANDVLTLLYNGTHWREVSRSVN